MKVEVQAVEMPAAAGVRPAVPAVPVPGGEQRNPDRELRPGGASPRQPRTEPRRRRLPARRAGRGSPEGQGSLDFLAAAPLKPRTLRTTVEAVIYCDAPVAVKLHRAVASALDWAMVLIAYGAFLVVFYAMGGSITLNKPNVMVFGGVLCCSPRCTD